MHGLYITKHQKKYNEKCFLFTNHSSCMMVQVLIHWDPTIGDAHDDPVEVNTCLFRVNYVNLNFTSKPESQGV
jgi:hypothetical protein